MEFEYHDAPQEPRVPARNGLGLAGFIVSLVGIVSCGLTAPIGLILSLVALKRPPKGLAIAGLVIGFVGCLEGVGAVILGVKFVKPMVETMAVLAETQQELEDRYRDTHEIPTAAEGQELIADRIDGWGTAIQYAPGESGFTLRSAGLDTIFGTEDDLKQQWSFVED